MGASHAQAVVAEGGNVVIGNLLDAEGRELAAKLDLRAVYTHLDVTDSNAWKPAVWLAVSTFGALNLLVNNAGISDMGPIGKCTEDQWNRIPRINLTGAVPRVTAAHDTLIAAAPSTIINVSSTGGLQGAPWAHGYIASKFAVHGLTKYVAVELGAHNVRANSAHPGAIRTPMTDGLDISGIAGVLDRIGEPSEVSNLVVYLARTSPASRPVPSSSSTAARPPGIAPRWKK